MSTKSETSYAIIRTGGRQFRVEPGKKYRFPTRPGEAGGTIEFADVLLGTDGKKVQLGSPKLGKARVIGEILRHGKGDKIIVFKMKRRKNYAKKQGHRQGFTEVKINDINLG